MKGLIVSLSFISFLSFIGFFNAEPVELSKNCSAEIFFNTDTIPSPEQLVQGQLEAYNLKDLEAFLSFFSDDIRAFNFPEKEIFSGKQNMRRGYESFFTQNPAAQGQVLQRMIMGNTVIDLERITGLAKGDTLRTMIIFKINKNKINRIYFIRE